MADARSGLKFETFADLELKAAARVNFTRYDESYRPGGGQNILTPHRLH